MSCIIKETIIMSFGGFLIQEHYELPNATNTRSCLMQNPNALGGAILAPPNVFRRSATACGSSRCTVTKARRGSWLLSWSMKRGCASQQRAVAVAVLLWTA
jgi:hypothetical protein